MNKTVLFGGSVIAVGIIVVGSFLVHDRIVNPNDSQQSAEAPVATPLSAEAKTSIDKGRYVAIAGDCVACHTAPGSGNPFAGGYALQTPFGSIVASNITSDRDTGIGDWTEAQFDRAVRRGVGRSGEHLYPAMPYTSYAKMTDDDLHNLWAYMKTVPAVNNPVDSNQLPFPFNIRLLMIGWNLLFFSDHPISPPSGSSAQWARGQYLVEGLEHCASCHTPKNAFGGDSSRALQGAWLQGWYAPEITNSKTSGIGDWSEQQIVDYLQTGGNHMAMASGPMAEAVTNSTQHLTQDDLASIAVYLKSIKGSVAAKPAAVPVVDPVMAQGKRVFAGQCEACHASAGTGIPSMVPRFAGNNAIQAPNTENLVRTVLQGGQGAMTQSNPTGAAMPSFAWNLTDEQIASVLTYIRNDWGNSAAPVSADTVAKTRASMTFRNTGPVPDDWQKNKAQ